MGKLPARVKVTVLCFRRTGPDEVLVVPREVKRQLHWGLPSAEAGAGETPRELALKVARRAAGGPAIQELDLGIEAKYRVGAGPREGEWTERFFAVEVAAGQRAPDGRWFPHYEAKAEAGAEAPRVREAFSRLRELAGLKP